VVSIDSEGTIAIGGSAGAINLLTEAGQLLTSNECYLASIDHLNVPALTTLADGTGTLVQYGGANAGWVQA